MSTNESTLDRTSLESELKRLGEENSDMISLFLYFGLQGILFATLLVSDYQQLKWEFITVYVTVITLTFLVGGVVAPTIVWYRNPKKLNSARMSLIELEKYEASLDTSTDC